MLQTLVLLHIRSIRTCRYYGGDSNLITFLKGDAKRFRLYIFISDHRIRINPLRIELKIAVLETAVMPLH